MNPNDLNDVLVVATMAAKLKKAYEQNTCVELTPDEVKAVVQIMRWWTASEKALRRQDESR